MSPQVSLDQPLEVASQQQEKSKNREHNSSNIILDLHGDPVSSKITVLSDGNHPMALEEAMAAFMTRHPEAGDVFYVTLPPGVILKIIQDGFLQTGNLHLPIRDDVLISPESVLDQLVGSGRVSSSFPL